MAFRDDYAQGRPAGEAGGQAVPATEKSVPATQKAAPQAAATAPTAPPAAAPPAKRKRPLRRLVLLALVAGGGAYGAYAGHEWWTTGRYIVSTDDAYVQADISTLAAKVSGYLEAVPVVNGQAVKAGDVIARIEDGDYRLALKAAEDKLATQSSTIARIARQAEAARAQVLQGQAQIDAAKADQVRAAADYQRQQQLAQSEFAAKSRLEQSRADRDRSDATVKGAEANLIALQANVAVLEAQTKEAENLAAELRTAVDRAKRDLSFTVLRAPFDGVIGNKATEAGAYVAPGSRIAALVPLQSARVDANFKETQLGRVRVGQPVHVRVDAWPDRDILGTVESLSPASGSVFSLLPPDNATGNFTKIVQRLPVRVRVPEAVAREGLLRPGLSVVVRVDTRGLDETKPPAPIEPHQAVSEGKGAASVRTAGR